MKKIKLNNISKNYGKKIVLDNVSLEITPGEIHILLGENGAGKSTLASILAGQNFPSSGTLTFDEKPIEFSEFSMVHQRPLLAKNLSVWENIILGSEPMLKPEFLGIINRRKAFAQIRILQKKLNLEGILDIKQSVSDLSADCVFYTAFLSALYKNPEVIILDEPCAPLDNSQRTCLYQCLKNLAKTGIAIIVITHNVQEAFMYADKVSVLRKGHLIFTGNVEDKAFEQIAEGMGKSHLIQNISYADEIKKEMILSVSNLSARPVTGSALFDISFSLSSGEILLILGQREAGMETLENILTGTFSEKKDGKISVGKEYLCDLEKKNLEMPVLRKFGCGIVPFNRTFRGSNPGLTVEDVAGIYESPKTKRKVAEQLVKKADIQISVQELASNLSGGMLQRLILARELHYNPKLLILSEPFQGLDAMACDNLVKQLTEVADTGTAILVLAAEASVLIKNSTKTFSLVSGHLQTFDESKTEVQK